MRLERNGKLGRWIDLGGGTWRRGFVYRSISTPTTLQERRLLSSLAA